MILHCTYEELSALKAGGERVLSEDSLNGVVIAPPEVLADVEALLPRLTGDLSVTTLAEQHRIARAVTFIVAELKQSMDLLVLENHPAAELAVHAYFEYAHALTVQDRVQRIGAEMTALVEVISGRPPTAEAARQFTFPD
jgi:hypothetical protein